MLSAQYVVVPLEEAPEQMARDGEDDAVMTLCENTLIASGVPLCIDCRATVNRAWHVTVRSFESNVRAHWWRIECDTLGRVCNRNIPARAS